MSSKDKTRDKLVGSMRKTKAGAGSGDSGEPKPAAAQPPAEPVAPKPAKATARPSRAQPKPVNRDNYQSGRRVWPD